MKKPVLLIPFAAPQTEPSYLLTDSADGMPFARSLSGLEPDAFSRVYVVLLKADDLRWGLAERIAAGFAAEKMAAPEFLRLEHPTESQPATIAAALIALSVQGPFWVKDPDNYFRTEVVADNVVTAFPLDALTRVNPQNKSYLSISDADYVMNIAEKRIIGRYFCSGGYGFADAARFLAVFGGLEHLGRLYLSHIIYRMLLDGESFRPLYVEDYQDWGTREDWLEFSRRKN